MAKYYLLDVDGYGAPKKYVPFYDYLCDDMVGYIIDFLGEDEKAEWYHVNRTMRHYMVEWKPEFRLPTCVRCGIYIKRCTCPSQRGQRRWCSCFIRIIVIGILIIVIGALMLAAMGGYKG